MTAPVVTPAFTAAYYPPLNAVISRGFGAPSKAKKQTWPVVAGSTVCRDLLITYEDGTPVNFTGLLESCKVELVIRNPDGSERSRRRLNPVSQPLGKWRAQLLYSDTFGLGGNYLYDVWVTYPGGVPIATSLMAQPLPIQNTGFSVATADTVVPDDLIAGADFGLPVDWLTIGDSITAGGSACTCVYGGYQGWIQHFCNVHGYMINWVGPSLGFTTAAPPTHIDGIAWTVRHGGIGGQKTQGVFAAYPHAVRDYLPKGGICTINMGTNNMQLTIGGGPDSVPTALANLTTMIDAYIADQALVNGPVYYLINTVCPQGGGLVPPSSANFRNEPATHDYNAGIPAIVAARFASGLAAGRIFVVDNYSRMRSWIGSRNQDYQGAIDNAAIAPYALDEVQIARTQAIGGTDFTMGTVGSNKAYTPSILADALHPTDLPGMQIIGEGNFILAQSLGILPRRL